MCKFKYQVQFSWDVFIYIYTVKSMSVSNFAHIFLELFDLFQLYMVILIIL